MQVSPSEPEFGRSARSLRINDSSQAYLPSSNHGIRRVVCLVEADDETRTQICAHLVGNSVEVKAYSSLTEFLNLNELHLSACLILDLQTAGQQTPDIPYRLAEEACPPVVFICGHGDIYSAVRAIKAGAIDLLLKPLDLSALAAAVKKALVHDEYLRQQRAELEKLRKRLSLLTPREREVLPLITGGLLNKQAASVLGISEVTFQIHRSQVMRKMQADSVAELVRMASKLRIPFWQRSQDELGCPPQTSHFRDRQAAEVRRLAR